MKKISNKIHEKSSTESQKFSRIKKKIKFVVKKKGKQIKRYLNPRKKDFSKRSTKVQSVTTYFPSKRNIETKKDFIQYYQQEDKNIIRTYGNEIFKYGRFLESIHQIPHTFLKNHQIEHNLRAKIVNYLFELIKVSKTEYQVFFLTVYIMDSFLSKTSKKHHDSEFFLVAFTSLLVSSKLECTKPFTIIDILQLCCKISKSSYTENDIREKETEIMLTLNFDFVNYSAYDFAETFIFDFTSNNSNEIDKFKMKDYVDTLDHICLHLLKVLLLDVEFNKYNQSLIAIACMIISYEILISNYPDITQEISSFLYTWINSLMSETRYPKEKVMEIYHEIKKLWEKNQNDTENNCD